MYIPDLKITAASCQSSIWKNRPSPWEIKGHLEVKISDGSGI